MEVVNFMPCERATDTVGRCREEKNFLLFLGTKTNKQVQREETVCGRKKELCQEMT